MTVKSSQARTILITILIITLVPLGRPLERIFSPIFYKYYPVSLIVCSLPFLYYALLFLMALLRSLKNNGMQVINAAAILAFLLTLFIAFKSDHKIELIHILLYSTVGYQATNWLSKSAQPSLSFSAAFYSAALAVFDEILQGIHPERIFDVRDILLNCSSAIMGIAYYSMASSSKSS
ncbi:MAG: VanZ family protein [Candidatus Dadabacteria bacterium]|nr:MAG: VanZ family protein [Candidatus Dadabacteria bacterium]